MLIIFLSFLYKVYEKFINISIIRKILSKVKNKLSYDMLIKRNDLKVSVK